MEHYAPSRPLWRRFISQALYAQRRRALHATFFVSAAAAMARRPVNICQLFPSIFLIFFMTPSIPLPTPLGSPSQRAGFSGLREGGQKRIYCVFQIFPCQLTGLPSFFQVIFRGLLQFLDAPLEIGKPVAHVFELPLMLERYADLLPGDPGFKHGNALRYVLNLRHDLLQIRLFKLHGWLPLLLELRKQELLVPENSKLRSN